MTVVYDKAKWHHERFGDKEVTRHLPPQQGFVHTGLYCGWIFERGLYSASEFADYPAFDKALADLKGRKTTGPQFYEGFLDGVLSDDLLGEEGKAFSDAYFNFETGLYLKDYEALLKEPGKDLYEVKDTWENFEKMSKRLDERFSEWRAGTLPAKAEPLKSFHKDERWIVFVAILVPVLVYLLFVYYGWAK